MSSFRHFKQGQNWLNASSYMLGFGIRRMCAFNPIMSRSMGTLLNEAIQFSTVRLVDGDGNDVMSIREASNRAKAEGLDLVCVAPDAKPPVCKIFDFHLETYRKRQSNKNSKQKKSTVGQIKEMKLKGLIEDHDLKIKCDKIADALLKSHPVRVLVSGDNKILRRRPDCLSVLPGRLLGILNEKSIEFVVHSQVSQRTTVELILMPTRKV
mmetsp:Transcript_19013/g.39198  ORF Transcript_19013/g.39198 Transcript_19013/m.39198 type:complete len:210 (+) Transcript_19013:149-778(+)